jgi:lysozyme
MRISDEGIKFIERWEGIKTKPYKDVVGLWTVGIGHLMLPGEDRNRDYSLDEVYDLFRLDIKRFEDGINNTLNVIIEQNHFDALVSLGYNIGLGGTTKGGLLHSTVMKKLNLGDAQGAGDAFLMWNKAGGRVIKGLVNRRHAERELFLFGKYN